MDLVPYAVPFFMLLMAAEYGYGRWSGNQTYRLNDSVNSLSCGILSTAIKILGLNIGGAAFSFVEQHWALTRLDAASPWTWLWTLLLYDFLYYWFHRISHERMLFWASHVVHHQSEEFNLSTALRQPSTGFLLTWVFYIPCFIVGIPVTVFVTVASVHLIYQFWIHSRHIPKLGVLEWFLVTASNHRVHHAQNARYVDRNYGGLLILWDRLFGTFEEERNEEPAVYGILGPLQSWNPLWANLHIFAQMFTDARRAASLGDKLRLLGARTGWRPADVAARYPLVKRGLADFRRFDPPVGARTAIHVGVQFVALLAFSLWLELIAPAAGWPLRLALFGYLLFGLVSVGVLMEAQQKGIRLEWLRLALGVLAVGALFAGGQVADPVLALLVGYCCVTAFSLQRAGRDGRAA